MSYINFDKHQLSNLEFSLSRELLRANRSGSYSCTTLVRCNTRKYHGLLVCPQPKVDPSANHVLLSCIDETIEQFGEQFNLSVHQFEGKYFHPKGHKYLREFILSPTPKMIYNVGGVVFSKEILYTTDGKDCLVTKYTLVDANHKAKLIIKPFLAFRNIHQLCKANDNIDRSFTDIANGIRTRMYDNYSYLHMQFSKKVEYKHNPDWYYNFEYQNEIDRGYEGHEDLYVPGSFSVEMKKGDSIYFSVATEEIKEPEKTLKKLFSQEEKNRTPRDTFENNLKNSAQQFVVKNKKDTEISSGFPWCGHCYRNTFIALPWITLTINDPQTCKAVLDSMLKKLNGALFPSPHGEMDTPLWFIWAIQMYTYHTKSQKTIWDEYGKSIQKILNGFRKGTLYNICMLDNGLLSGGEAGNAITWMNASVDGNPITPRTGLPVEVNALWYNAIKFSIEVATAAKDQKFLKTWTPVAEQIPDAFKSTFWSKEKGYLADYVNGDFKDFSVRSNQIIATGLPYSPISLKIQQLVLEKCKQVLLTNRGLRSLSPEHEDYKPKYEGDFNRRNLARHQGSVWVWPLSFFAEGYLRVYEASGLDYIKKLYQTFEPAITEYCIGSIAEIYDGDPPHRAKGAVSYASAVGALLRIKQLITDYKPQK